VILSGLFAFQGHNWQIRETDMAARLAGDEFDMLARSSVYVGASIGVTLQLPHDPQEPARRPACRPAPIRRCMKPNAAARAASR
jgi:hypothetical protein